ncbi:Putative nuclease [Frankliniella fusca]|uniref:Nuclease n=1 Tax=Frankliniella fusca TaxID=407009 RepID=A0AAE1HE49_9NEOP|nr:Putative nuclease [Frankliniella fusca]
MWQFPNCVGALDGQHCVFQKFRTRGSEFYNYKGSHSVVLLALCDAKHSTIASETLAQNIILSTVALHNLHLQREDSIPPKQRVYSPPGFADTFKGNEEDFYAQLADQEINRPNPTEDDDIAPILIREKFLKLFIHEPVPWQWRIIPPIEEPTSTQ